MQHLLHWCPERHSLNLLISSVTSILLGRLELECVHKIFAHALRRSMRTKHSRLAAVRAVVYNQDPVRVPPVVLARRMPSVALLLLHILAAAAHTYDSVTWQNDPAQEVCALLQKLHVAKKSRHELNWQHTLPHLHQGTLSGSLQFQFKVKLKRDRHLATNTNTTHIITRKTVPYD